MKWFGDLVKLFTKKKPEVIYSFEEANREIELRRGFIDGESHVWRRR